MNRSHLQDFEGRVLRVVRQIAASPLRKRAMQEELLAHLVGIYEQELARQGDERSAAAAARRRFGNANEIGQQLQESVPFLERTISECFRRKELLMSRWSWILGGAALLIGWAVVFPEFAELTVGALLMLGGLEMVRACQGRNLLAIWVGGAAATLFGPAIILPALAQFTHEQRPLEEVAGPLVLGVLVTLGGLGLLAYGIMTQRTRTSPH